MDKFDFNLEVVLNPLSFGAVSYNILREMWLRGLQPNIKFKHNNADGNSYIIEPEFKKWIESGANGFYTNYNKNYPGLSLWHLNESEYRISNKTALLTFFELDKLTEAEKNIAQNQDKVLLTSDYSMEVFKAAGLENTTRINLGFDSTHFKPTNKTYLPDVITFSIFGKAEKRKRHEKVIKTWIKKYGGNGRYALHLMLTNPHMNEQQHQQFFHNVFEGKPKPFNINILPRVGTSDSVNDALNATNIVIDLGTESWSMMSFHAVGLGKFGVIGNYGGLKSWANDKNSVLVNSNSMIPAEDGIFFHPNSPFNVGNIFDFDENELVAAFELVEKRYLSEKVNKEGLKIQEEFTWKKTVDVIEEELRKL